MNKYSLEQPFVDELVEDLRTGLLQEFHRLGRVDAETCAWTNFVKSTLAERCRDHFMNGDFFAFSSNTFGEYLLDFSYGSYPPAFNSSMPVKKGFDYRLFVACESEWGVKGDVARTHTAVLDDFCKLLDVRAQVKILIFGYDEPASEKHANALQNLKGAFEALLDSRKEELAGETWLFMGVPWNTFRYVSSKLNFSSPLPETLELNFVDPDGKTVEI